MQTVVVSGPTSEPITLVEARLQIATTGGAWDDLLNAYIPAARDVVETLTKRKLLRQTLRVEMDYFPDVIRLEYPPLAAVTSVEYVDNAGVLQTLSPSLYQVDPGTDDRPARIAPAFGTSWPQTRREMRAVRVTYSCGYETAADLNAAKPSLRHAMLMLISHWFEHREASGVAGMETPLAVAICTQPHRVNFA